MIVGAEPTAMGGPNPPTIALAAVERQALARLVCRYASPQQLALRARLVLAAAEGANTGQLARPLNVSLDMGRRWRARWRALQPVARADLPIPDRLSATPRPGKPTRITAAQVGQMVALAWQPPAGAERPISQSTGREIADDIKKRGIVVQISGRRAARLLTRGRASHT